MLKRFLSLLKALFATEQKASDDPARLLKQAQIQMREAQVLNRRRAVDAVPARNHLQQQLNDMWSRIDELTDQITDAEQRGDNEEAQKMRQKRDDTVESLARMDAHLTRAIEMSEQSKDAIQREEEKIRQKTREALKLKAQWRNTLDENNRYPPQNDLVIKWVIALIWLCLLGLLILRVIG